VVIDLNLRKLVGLVRFLKLSVGLKSMNLRAITFLLKSKRFWIWTVGGVVIYAVPALIRFATGNVYVPVLGWFETPWIGHYVPGNLVEKIFVNAFFPGGAGAVAGEIFFAEAYGKSFEGKQKYLARLGGALLATGAWSLFQLWGNMQNISGSWGGNVFEYPMVYPLNFLLASLSIFTPGVVDFIKSKLAGSINMVKCWFQR
jgi:hypothetical protein